MKKGIFLASLNPVFFNEETSGVRKKIFAQLKILSDHFDIQFITENNLDSFLKKVLALLPFTSFEFKTKYDERFKNIDFIYNRYVPSDYNYIRFLRKLKINNPNCKVVVEVNTYPYEPQMIANCKKKPWFWVIVWKDRHNQKKMFKYVDRIVTYSNDNQIFNIPTIVTINGVSVDKIRPRVAKKYSETIGMIGIARFVWHHGYDRLLEGLREYYQHGGKRNICLHLVGEGKVSPLYKKMISDYNLQDHVIMHGARFGDELDAIYDQCEIGVETLGWHRVKVENGSTLKSREFWAKGLLMITESELLQDIAAIQQYVLKVPFDDSPINMENVISFYDRAFSSSEAHIDVPQKIRSYAEKVCDMSVTMKPIIDYLKAPEVQ